MRGQHSVARFFVNLSAARSAHYTVRFVALLKLALKNTHIMPSQYGGGLI